MPQTPKPEAAAQSAAFALSTKVRLAISELAGLEEIIEKLHAFTLECDAWHTAPKGFDLEDIPETPFQVVYSPKEPEDFHGIYCRGVNVTEHVTEEVTDAATLIVREAWLDANDPQRLKDAADLRRLDESRGK